MVSDDINEKDLPKWAQDRLKAERLMGKPQFNLGFWEGIGIMFGIGLRVGGFLLFCVIVYLIGSCVVG